MYRHGVPGCGQRRRLNPKEDAMQKLLLACAVLLALAAFTAPSAQALPICFKWVDFCDGVQVNSPGIGGAFWYNWNCADNSPMDAKAGGNFKSNCGTNGTAVARNLAPNGPGNFYFIIDTPLDGTLDMNQGLYDLGVCFIPNLAYTLLMGECVGIKGQSRSTVQ